MLGYAGQILYVDLTTDKIRTEKLSDETAKKYIGGIGLGMELWLSNSKAGVNPLSAETLSQKYRQKAVKNLFQAADEANKAK